MRFVVFSQSTRPSLPLDAFGGDVLIDHCVEDASAPLPTAALRLRRGADGLDGAFRLLARPSVAGDVEAARGAARRGGAAGMDSLAERCPTVVEVTSDDAPPRLVYAVCAAIATRCLGPILPPDGSTLLGVRSARRRAE